MGLGIAILIVQGLVGGGGFGDRSLSVTYLNETAQRVTVYPYGRNYEAGKRVIGPGEKATDSLLANGGDGAHMAQVEAFDDTGGLVFCHSFTVGELRGLGGVVRVKVGQK